MPNATTTPRPRLSAGLVLAAVVGALIGLSTPRANATWSIILVDTESKEIAVGSATCLEDDFDLERWLPVMLVDIGAGCAQSYVDSSGNNRRRIRDELLAGTPPAEILEILEAGDSGHQTRQYGIVDTPGRAATFTGSKAGQYAGGVVGYAGTLAYAIQGNVITGPPVIEMAELAVLSTDGDLPEKLMAGMEAARSMGGDGRCSCSSGNPTGCGSPPVNFEKSAHIGFMIVTRTGDVDGNCNVTSGCATGDYYLNFNVAFQQNADPDPVIQLQEMFDAWRANLLGRPDAVHATATLDPGMIPGYEAATATMTITVRDWEDTPVDGAGLQVTVEHAEDSAHIVSIGEPVHLGGGVFETTLTGNPGGGIDRFRVTVDDSIRPIVVIPLPALIVARKADLDFDGDVDVDDHAIFVGCLLGPGVPPGDPDCVATDFDVDKDVDLNDFARLQFEFTAAPCTVLHIVTDPVWGWTWCGDPFTLTVEAKGDPEPRFQWLFHGLPKGEGVPIPGATEPIYHIEFAGDGDRGYHSCLISNACGTLQSDAVLVRVIPDPCE